MKPQHHRQHHIVIQLIRTPNGYAPENIEFVDNMQPNNTIRAQEMPARLQSETLLLTRINLPSLLDQNEAAMKTMPPMLIQETHNDFNGHAMIQNTQSAQKQKLSAIGELKHAPKWFRLDDIHDLQMQALPEFFNGKSYKTLELYRKYRDFIVRLHQTQPHKYLTKIACRRVLKGDANAILRIHRFLEEQGIINIDLNPLNSNQFGSSTINRCRELALNIKQIPSLKQTHKGPDQPSSESLIFSVTSRILSKNYRSFCIRCGMICGVVMFQRKQVTREQYICQACYLKLEQNEKTEYQKSDVVKRIISEPHAKNQSNWGVDKMIEELAVKNSTWSSIYDKIGNGRTKEDIIFHFLQFPITNVRPNDLPFDQKLQLSIQQQIRIVRQLYEKSLYKYDMSEDTKQLFNRQPLNDDLKIIIQLELQKYSKRLLVMEEFEAVHTLNEMKSNIASIIINRKLTKKHQQEQSPAPLVMAETVSVNAYDPLVESQQSHQEFFNNGGDDVDRYLQ